MKKLCIISAMMFIMDSAIGQRSAVQCMPDDPIWKNYLSYRSLRDASAISGFKIQELCELRVPAKTEMAAYHMIKPTTGIH